MNTATETPVKAKYPRSQAQIEADKRYKDGLKQKRKDKLFHRVDVGFQLDDPRDKRLYAWLLKQGKQTDTIKDLIEAAMKAKSKAGLINLP